MIYFTSDLHIGHTFIAALRGFSELPLEEIMTMDRQELANHTNVAAHDNTLLENINKVVNVNDTLYILGDIFSGTMSKLTYVEQWLTQLKVAPKNRHLVLGNHDGSFHPKTPLRKFFAEHFATTQTLAILPDKKLYLSHLPPKTAYKAALEKGADSIFQDKYVAVCPDDLPMPAGWKHLHGHTHSSDAFQFSSTADPTIINVCPEAWDLSPVSYDVLRFA